MSDPFLGRRIDAYEVRAPLGAGGMARVYRAYDHKLAREVALKLLYDPHQSSPGLAERFLQEARTLASLNHAGIVPIFNVGQHDGIPYLVQELLPGPTLEDELAALQRQGRFMESAEVLRVIAQLASALDYAHQRGIIHRDLKPSNVLRNALGAVVLVDFGIAKTTSSAEKLTQTGMVMGTPHYLAPEQAMGQALTPAVDFYALGVILFELLTNRLPFDDPSALAIALAHVNQQPPLPSTFRPDLPPGVEDVVMKALAKDPAYRYASAGELAIALTASWSPAQASQAPPAHQQVHDDPRPRAAARQRAALGAPAPVDTAQLPTDEEPGAPRPDPAPVRGPRPGFRPTPLMLGAGLLLALLVIVGITRLGRDTSVAGTNTTPAAATRPAQGQADGGAAATQPAQAQAGGEPTAAPAGNEGQPPAPPPAQGGGGRPITLVYDEQTFYVVNQSQETLDIGPLRFEGLGTDGQVTQQFSAGQWPFPVLKTGQCSRLQVLGSPQLARPAECAREATSLERNPQRAGMLFWSTQAGSSEFRVIWQEQEVGRCPAGPGSCEVALP